MTFDEWINELDGLSSRLEKIQEELLLNRYIDNHTFWKRILSWLKVSYFIGYVAGKTEILDTMKVLNSD